MAPSRGATTSRTPLIGLWRTAALLAALSPLSPINATAQEEAAAPEPQEEGTQEASRYRNKLSGFVGGTAEGEGVAFTLGLDYERRLGRSFGLGALVDKAYAGNRAFIAAGAFFWHPLPTVRLDIAPGVEWMSTGDEEDSAFVLRFGADYDFELTERWSLGPNVNLDLAEGRAVFVFGVELGLSF